MGTCPPPQVGGVSDEMGMVTGFVQLAPLSDCTADPSSHQRGHPIETRPQLSDSNLPTGSNIWSQVPELAQHQDILTD
jgi:hypothetical protein